MVKAIVYGGTCDCDDSGKHRFNWEVLGGLHADDRAVVESIDSRIFGRTLRNVGHVGHDACTTFQRTRVHAIVAGF